MSAAETAQAVLLGLGVLALWLAAFGLLRLRDAFARLHCIGVAGAAGGLFFTAAVFVSSGASALAFKSLVGVLFVLFGGAVAAHATGRALRLRQETQEWGK